MSRFLRTSKLEEKKSFKKPDVYKENYHNYDLPEALYISVFLWVLQRINTLKKPQEECVLHIIF